MPLADVERSLDEISARIESSSSGNLNPSDLYANKVLFIMASRSSSETALFSNWMIGASGVVLALLVANIESISNFIPAKSMAWAVYIFLGAVVLNVIQRYLVYLIGRVGARFSASEHPLRITTT